MWGVWGMKEQVVQSLSWVSGKGWCCAPRRALACGEGGRSFGWTLDFSDRIIDQVGMWMASGLQEERRKKKEDSMDSAWCLIKDRPPPRT